jgi:5-methylcytosine-specific restriction protein A
MPTAPRSFCLFPRCPNRVPSGYCQQHERPTSTARLYTYAWRQARLVFLRDHPLCVACMREGFVEPATDVDHIQPHRGNDELFWNRESWQALCASCHSRKTAMGG